MNGGVDLYTRSLDQLSTSLEEWAAEDEVRLGVLAALRQQVDTACPALPGSEAVTEFCDQFLRVAGQLPSADADGAAHQDA